jgi:hypothetical protein
MDSVIVSNKEIKLFNSGVEYPCDVEGLVARAVYDEGILVGYLINYINTNYIANRVSGTGDRNIASGTVILDSLISHQFPSYVNIYRVKDQNQIRDRIDHSDIISVIQAYIDEIFCGRISRGPAARLERYLRSYTSHPTVLQVNSVHLEL